jgi:hypothetical protein
MGVLSATWTTSRVGSAPGEPSSTPWAMRGSILAKSAPGHVSGTRVPRIRPNFGL